MKIPENYENTVAMKSGEYTDLPPGAYNCVIKHAVDTQTKNGRNMLELWLDIDEDAYKDFFEKQYRDIKEKFGEAKWRGKFNQLTDGKSVGYFKGLIEDIQNSNNGFIFNFDEKTLKEKKIGGVFGRKEYINQKNEKKFVTICFDCIKITEVKEFEAPPDRLLDSSKAGNGSHGYTSSTGSTMEELDTESDLPF